MLKKLFTGFMLLALLTGLLAIAPAAPVAAQAGQGGISPDALLNPDGTLKLDGSTRGNLDLSDYSVQMDPQRGPVFTPLATQNEWTGVGDQGGPFQNSIDAVIVIGTNVYVAGLFQDAAGIPEADSIARWDGTQWLALGSNGDGDGAIWGGINALLFTGGTLYVGGEFTDIYDTNGVQIPNASHLARWNGSTWSAVPGLAFDLNGTVNDLAHYAGTNVLYIAGNFANVNANTIADYVVGINLDTSALVTLGDNGASNGALTDEVSTLAVDSTGIVYAGGFFTNISDGVNVIFEADYIAKWSGAVWSALGNDGVGTGALNSIVVDLAVDASDNLYVGGWFYNAAGIPEADFIAKWNGASWEALGSDGSGDGALLSGSGGSTIQAVLVSGTDVYVGGFFTGSSGIPTADFIARYDTTGGTWSGLGSNGAGNGSLNYGVYDMAFSAGSLYAVGDFYDVNNGGTLLPTADHFAVWNGSSWSTLGEANGVFQHDIETMAVVGADVYAGGYFVDAGGDPRIDYIARWDGSKWNPVGNLNQSYGALNGIVRALAVDGTDLYIGGDFTFVYDDGTPLANSGYIIKWDGSTFTSLGGGLNNSVRTLAVDASHNVYAGGSFMNAGGIPEADYIARWNGSAWSALAGNGSSDGAVSGPVFALALNSPNLYVGGTFTSVKNTSNATIPNTAYLAKWDGSAWSAMDGITQPVNNPVYVLTASGTDLYMGGMFTNLNGSLSMDRIAKWDGAAWSALGFTAVGEGSLNSLVSAIAVSGGRVYAGGSFINPVNSSGTPLTAGDYVAMWNGSQWVSLGSNGASDGSLNGIVNALMIKDDDLWVGGAFSNVNSNGTLLPEADKLAVFGLDLPPQVVSITCLATCKTFSPSVTFTVTFSEAMLNVDAADFELTTTGALTGASITGVSGSGATRTVTVNTGTGNGTIRLDIPVTASIDDTNGNALGSLPYTGGQAFTVKKILTFRSSGLQDGWILESGANTSTGGTMDSASTTLRLGDEATRGQYRSLLSFNTSSLPDNATITKVTLKVRRQGVVGGGNPVNLFQGFMVDIRKGTVGTAALQLTDWQAVISKTLGPFNLTPLSGWYTLNLTPGKAAVNKLTTGSGLTQIRLRFQTQDNGDFFANVLSLYSGNAGSGSRPQLIIEFSVP